jgi:hypothetical protein
MLACALLILPVASVTRLGTRFEVDERFFVELTRAGETLAPKQATALERLRGHSYGTARDFATALEKVSAPAPLNAQLQATFIAAARSNDMYWVATLLIALAAAAHQAWAANMFSLIGDYVPQTSVASVAGFSGAVGVLASMIADFFVGRALTATGTNGYFVAFLGAGTVYLVVLGLFQLLVRPPTATYA